MTPPNIAAFMVSLLPKPSEEFHLLNAGAGEGSLTCAFFDALRNGNRPFPCGESSLFELDAAMVRKLEESTTHALGVLPIKGPGPGRTRFFAGSGREGIQACRQQ
jgi:hypothetical protein